LGGAGGQQQKERQQSAHANDYGINKTDSLYGESADFGSSA
jgi:hypothetical protein